MPDQEAFADDFFLQELKSVMQDASVALARLSYHIESLDPAERITIASPDEQQLALDMNYDFGAYYNRHEDEDMCAVLENEFTSLYFEWRLSLPFFAAALYDREDLMHVIEPHMEPRFAQIFKNRVNTLKPILTAQGCLH